MATMRVIRATCAPAAAATRVVARGQALEIVRQRCGGAVATLGSSSSKPLQQICHGHQGAQLSSLSSRASAMAGRSLPSSLAQRVSRRLSLARFSIRADYHSKFEGEPGSLDFRLFLLDDAGTPISPWHDVPLHAGDGMLNFVCEIPKESSAKMEVATDEIGTPIKQDTKKGKLRFYPYNINWNYGMLPQTWEDPSHANEDVENAFGDNDPVDVIEIGERTIGMGEVIKVKPVAVYAMIDEGELDWKVVAIAADDPKAHLVNDVADVEEHFPGTLEAIRVWFRDYKIPDGKPANKFGLDDKPMEKEYALKVIKETNEFWAKLVLRSTPKRELSLI